MATPPASPPAAAPRKRPARKPPLPKEGVTRDEGRALALEELRRRLADPALRAAMSHRDLTSAIATLNAVPEATPTTPLATSAEGAAFLRQLLSMPADGTW